MDSGERLKHPSSDPNFNVLHRHIFDLPRELHIQIISKMSLGLRAKFARTCRYFRDIVKEYNEEEVRSNPKYIDSGPPLSATSDEDDFDYQQDYEVNDAGEYDDVYLMQQGDDLYDSDVSG